MIRAERLVALTAMLKHVRDTEKAISDLLTTEYPIGTKVRFAVGLDRFFDGEIKAHGYGRRVRVRNTKTHRDRWIRVGDLQRGEASR